MAFPEAQPVAGQKRKRLATKEDSKSGKASRKTKVTDPEDREAEILALEQAIAESRKNYNDIVKLHAIAEQSTEDESVTLLACVALCRVFCRLRIQGALKNSKALSQSERTIVGWLKERYDNYTALLLQHMLDGPEEVQASAVSLYMRLVKEEVKEDQYAWNTGLFPQIGRILLTSGENTAEASGGVFIEDYVLKYDDVRFHFLGLIPSAFAEAESEATDPTSNILELLMMLEVPTSEAHVSQVFFGPEPTEIKGTSKSMVTQKKRVSQAWLSLLARPLDNSQQKEILLNFVPKIIPWFSQVERLMDFLTDCYNAGGSTSLLALSGIYYLIENKNLDYPDFYTKLYSLLDDDLLHSKHRSRFFRHLDTFMGSTHLPAALVASFIKRLARLALQAPPAAIVSTVPWIYNMLKKHPQCSFLIHREPASPQQQKRWETEGFIDPFDMAELDPMLTGAIDSSIWEIETLQSHYHANVATLAKIISEQFTKQTYNMEDFLDHSYGSLLESELTKDLKKTPVVEYQIPKRIVMGDDGESLNPLGKLLSQALVST